MIIAQSETHQSIVRVRQKTTWNLQVFVILFLLTVIVVMHNIHICNTDQQCYSSCSTFQRNDICFGPDGPGHCLLMIYRKSISVTTPSQVIIWPRTIGLANWRSDCIHFTYIDKGSNRGYHNLHIFSVILADTRIDFHNTRKITDDADGRT